MFVQLQKKLLIICLFLVAVLLVSGCFSVSGNDAIAGKYVEYDEGNDYIELNSDGTCTQTIGDTKLVGEYTIEGTFTSSGTLYHQVRACYTNLGGVCEAYTIDKNSIAKAGRDRISRGGTFIKR